MKKFKDKFFIIKLGIDMVNKIGVIGAGAMGSSIAEVFAYNGYEVILKDVSMDYSNKGFNNIKRILNDFEAYNKKLPEKEILRMEKNGIELLKSQKDKILENLYKPVNIESILKRITPSDSYDSLNNCDIIIEAAFEDQNVKNKIFEELSKYTGENTIVATNTSSLSITEMASHYKYPNKAILMHFFNPPYTLPLIEIAPSTQGSDEAAREVYNLLSGMKNHRDKMYPVMTKDRAGFIVNRILLQVINEAVKVYDENIASKEDIDIAMKKGAGFPMGPFELVDYVGVDIVYDVLKTFNNVYGDRFNVSETLKNLVLAGYNGKKSGKGFYNYAER